MSAQIKLVHLQIMDNGSYDIDAYLSFKAGKYGQLTYMRIYQGMLKRGQFIVNTRTGKRVKVPRVIQMHADQMQVRG